MILNHEGHEKVSLFQLRALRLHPAFTSGNIACSCEDAAINECRVVLRGKVITKAKSTKVLTR